METPTKSKDPTGGVHKPIHRLTTIIIPKWTGSTPTLVTTGKNMGVKISTAGVMSIKVPTNNKMRLITIKITHLLSLTVSINSLIKCGISSADITQDILIEVPINNSTTADVSEDRTKMSDKSDTLSSL